MVKWCVYVAKVGIRGKGACMARGGGRVEGVEACVEGGGGLCGRGCHMCRRDGH